jgi:uncharacterized protein YdhG (YjbR/CyaY superfamily)
MKKSKPTTTVEDYLAALPEDTRIVLENLRRTILAAAPKAEEIISYQIPTYKLNGPLVHFMAGKSHCSFVTVDKTVLAGLQKELAGFKVSGTTIHFTAANPLPATLVKKIVKARLKQNAAATRK